MVNIESRFHNASLTDLECFILGFSQFDNQPETLINSAVTQLEHLLKELHFESSEIKSSEIQFARQVTTFLLGLSRMSIDPHHPVICLLLCRAASECVVIKFQNL